MNPLSDPAFTAGLRPVPAATPGNPAGWPAADITGVQPTGEPVAVHLDDVAGRLLVAFLAGQCDGCREFWAGLTRPDALGLPPDVSLVAVTKGPDTQAPALVADAATGVDRVPVVMGDQAWSDYRVLGYPFFVLVEAATRSVVGEAVGLGWDDVLALTRTPG